MKRNQLRSLVLAALALGTSAPLFARTFVITVAPPPLRVYAQPVCPGDDYIWTPGHWAYGPNGYYWVPGAWVLAPQPGYLFTPGYWAFSEGVYVWHPGHWGLTIGYYGGVNYGFGYTGNGFYGGHWERGHFFYNRAYNNVDERRVHRFYRDEARERDRHDLRYHDHARDDRDHRPEHREDERHGHRNDHPGAHTERNSAHQQRAFHSGGGNRSGHRGA